MDHAPIELDSSTFCLPVKAANRPDQLSTEGVSTFFDFDTYDGFAPESSDILMSHDAGLTQGWNLVASPERAYWSGSAHDNHDIALSPGTENSDDKDLAWALQEYRIIRQVAQEQLPVSMSWIEPGLSPYADGQLFTQPIGQLTSYLSPAQDFIRDSSLENLGELSLSLNRHCHNVGIINTGTATNSGPTVETSAFDIKPLIAPSVESPPRLKLALSTKKKRTWISNAAKKILNEHFTINPYPTEKETSALESRTRLPSRTIRTWFSNSRSRKKVMGVTSLANSGERISRTSLEAFAKISPAASRDSLYRYLAQPTSEDPIRLDAITAGNQLIAMNSEITDDDQVAIEKLPEQLSVSRRGSSTQAGSVAGSDSSHASAQSRTSQKSFRSVDSRGSRRGRKLWKRTQASVKELLHTQIGVVGEVQTLESSSPNNKKRPAPYYCSWPTCNAQFQFRSEWTRHEEAVHYQPYQWICCLEDTYEKPFGQCFICGRSEATIGHIATEHFTSCFNKTRAERTFYRRDQLIQHIKGTHSFSRRPMDIHGEYVLTDLARHWEVASAPCPDIPRLTCGFCGTICKTWQARQDHVSKHLQSGICKQSWWFERKSAPCIMPLGIEDVPVKCINCGAHCESVIEARENHSSCVAWSCRYLHDWHAIYIMSTTETIDDRTFTCQLCNFTKKSTDKHLRAILEEHAQSHNLRSCAQHRFADVRSFASHLEAQHNAVWKGNPITMFQPWKCYQKIGSTPEGPVVAPKQTFQKSLLCASSDSPFHDDVYGLLAEAIFPRERV